MRQTPAQRQAAYRKRHPERVKAARIEGKERDRAWRKENQERINALAREKYIKKTRRPPFDERAWRSKWMESNRDWYLARSAQYAAARRAIQKLATPAWANLFFIKEIYHLSRLRTKHLGTKHQVDHIIPLYGKNVCGLHVEQNLRVIPAIENIRKSNFLLDNVADPMVIKLEATKEVI